MAKRANRVGVVNNDDPLSNLHFAFCLQQNIGYVSDQLDNVLLQQIYPLLYSVSFPEVAWANEEIEKVIVTLLSQWA